jgi:hypothetical protein
MDMWHGNGNAALTWTCNIDLDMQHLRRHAALIWTCRMDLNLNLAAQTWT